MIPMCDIDLRHQIRVDKLRTNESGVVNAQSRGRACVRRMHSAMIAGRKSRVTVAIYQGDDAEEEWCKDIATYMSLRHPNIVQICGAASSNGLHAAIFNDDLIPLRHFLDHYRVSPFSTVYIFAHLNQDFAEVINYLYSALQRPLRSSECISWLRRSTGRLCTEFAGTSDSLWLNSYPPEAPALSGIYSVDASSETITRFIDSLTVKQYHNICNWNLRQHRRFRLPAFTTLNLGAVFRRSSDRPENPVEIAFLPSTEAPILYNWRTSDGGTGEIMPNGWTRFQSGHVINNTVHVLSTIPSNRHAWLSQANHIFRRLNIMANFADYVIVHWICFYLVVLHPPKDPPEGFLFLCPTEDFRSGPSSFCCPACPAYWSLDPSGVYRLGPEEATQRGFPIFKLTTEANGYSWDDSIYEGLRQFHEAKGFDPYSQDVVRDLGYPFYLLSSERDALPWAYDSEDEHFDADVDSGSNSAYIYDYESEYPCTSACNDSGASDSQPHTEYWTVITVESSHKQETVHDLAGKNCESEHPEWSNCTNHHVSESTMEEVEVVEEISTPSWSLNVLMSMQLAMILFLGFSWVYDHVSVSFV
ncbi:hypothetical protein MSAN_00119100 [Mycena sanguinolenta]|uniref:Uncharacterized protein n=1 Tax=Mycena sanguinolenta TaxID=230812 RepID=A0A8H6ZHK2_9AGAR|nr:hypothetical protein MSAN_00119100 [Mycena sanguinolenta]